MDMKRILQAMDGVTNKPVEGADSMAKFLRTVTEAEINPPTAPVAPTAPQAPQAPAQPQVDPAHYQVPSIDFLKKNNAHPSDVINGAQPSPTDPSRIGSWEAGSDFDDLMMALNGSYYQARKADPNYKQPAFVKDDWELVQRMLGTPEGKEYAIANWIGLSDVNDTSPEAQFNRDQHHEFEKQANAKLMQQPDGVITPGWKYDQKLGMTPAQAALQAQKAQQPAPTTVQESMDKFLSIVKKNDVSILNEGTNPHKVTLPVQMAMQHYQQAEPVTTTSNESSMFKKYFHEVENEVNEQATAKRQIVNQYASVIAERVMKKQSKNTITEMDKSEPGAGRDTGPRSGPDKAAKPITAKKATKDAGGMLTRAVKDSHKKKGVAEAAGSREKFTDLKSWAAAAKQQGLRVGPANGDSNYSYWAVGKGGEVFGKFVTTRVPQNNHGYIKKQGVAEMAIAYNTADANNPMIHNHEKANSMHLKDRIAQARAQLKELAQLADSNELVVWEKITRLSKGGMFMGLEQNLEQIRHGINELVQARKTGKQFPPKARGAIDKNIG